LYYIYSPDPPSACTEGLGTRLSISWRKKSSKITDNQTNRQTEGEYQKVKTNRRINR